MNRTGTKLVADTIEQDQIERIVRSLEARLPPDFSAAAIAVEVQAELASYAAVRVTQFVPVLVENRVWARLRLRRSA